MQNGEKMKMKKKTIVLAAMIGSCIMAGNSFAGEWKTSPSGWWYQNDDGTYWVDGWQWIDGKCYYFTPDGYCLTNTITPDGNMVDENGAWIVNGIIQTQEETPTADSAANPSNIFALSSGSYYFSSGAGGWGTTMNLNADGSFTGSYSDTDMGVSEVTIYQCNFHGQFKNPVQVNEYTYQIELDGNIEIEPRTGGEFDIEDGILIHYIDSEPYGLETGRVFYLYLPGSPLSSLPEEFINWVWLDKTLDTLPFYGLYNIEGSYGFAHMN